MGEDIPQLVINSGILAPEVKQATEAYGILTDQQWEEAAAKCGMSVEKLKDTLMIFEAKTACPALKALTAQQIEEGLLKHLLVNTKCSCGKPATHYYRGKPVCADVHPIPFRNQGPKIGRNDPCPCHSGRKYKSCCMRKGK
jgi:uncharacterized protein YecA (UPF0149 family)